MTRSIFRLLPPPGCPTGTVIAPGDMRGYRRLEESGLSDTKYFSRHDLWRVVGKKCRVFRGCNVCGAEPYNRHRFNRFLFVTGTPSRLRPQRVKLCGLVWHSRSSLTVKSRPINSVVESGGPQIAASIEGQTGNSGEIPGRPRRCIQATSHVGKRGRLLSGHCERHGTTVRLARRHAAG